LAPASASRRRVEAETYEAAQDLVADQLPDGWQVISYRVVRDGL